MDLKQTFMQTIEFEFEVQQNILKKDLNFTKIYNFAGRTNSIYQLKNGNL